MFNPIKRYIDKKVEQQAQKRLKNLRADAQCQVPEAVRNQTIKYIDAILKSEQPEREERLHPEVTRFFRGLERYIRDRFRDELANIQRRHRNLKSLEGNLKEMVENHTNEHVSSEEFLDQIIGRIKQKQITS